MMHFTKSTSFQLLNNHVAPKSEENLMNQQQFSTGFQSHHNMVCTPTVFPMVSSTSQDSENDISFTSSILSASSLYSPMSLSIQPASNKSNNANNHPFNMNGIPPRRMRKDSEHFPFSKKDIEHSTAKPDLYPLGVFAEDEFEHERYRIQRLQKIMRMMSNEDHMFPADDTCPSYLVLNISSTSSDTPTIFVCDPNQDNNAAGPNKRIRRHAPQRFKFSRTELIASSEKKSNELIVGHWTTFPPLPCQLATPIQIRYIIKAYIHRNNILSGMNPQATTTVTMVPGCRPTVLMSQPEVTNSVSGNWNTSQPTVIDRRVNHNMGPIVADRATENYYVNSGVPVASSQMPYFHHPQQFQHHHAQQHHQQQQQQQHQHPKQKTAEHKRTYTQKLGNSTVFQNSSVQPISQSNSPTNRYSSNVQYPFIKSDPSSVSSSPSRRYVRAYPQPHLQQSIRSAQLQQQFSVQNINAKDHSDLRTQQTQYYPQMQQMQQMQQNVSTTYYRHPKPSQYHYQPDAHLPPAPILYTQYNDYPPQNSSCYPSGNSFLSAASYNMNNGHNEDNAQMMDNDDVWMPRTHKAFSPVNTTQNMNMSHDPWMTSSQMNVDETTIRRAHSFTTTIGAPNMEHNQNHGESSVTAHAVQLPPELPLQCYPRACSYPINMRPLLYQQ